MSHWFSVKTKFTSVTAIEKAATELGFMVRRNAKCRGYNNQSQVCDLMVKLHGEYDLGLIQQADGSYLVSADFWSEHISKYLCNPTVLEKAEEKAKELAKEGMWEEGNMIVSEAKMSRFTQEYNRFATRELIEAQGMQYMESVAEDGSYVLEILDYQQDAQITTRVLTDGSLKVEANGYTGNSCAEHTRFLKSLGVVTVETQKPEYYDCLTEGVKHDG
jgi:hypothetical protein